LIHGMGLISDENNMMDPSISFGFRYTGSHTEANNVVLHK